MTIEKYHLRLTKEEKVRIETELDLEGIKLISLNYQKFGIGLIRWIPSFFYIIFIILFNKISSIHAWCTPGGVIGLILSFITGKQLILDSFEPHAEVMTETKTWHSESLKFKILFRFEGWMAKRSDFQICCTESMKYYAFDKYKIQLSNPLIKPACVQLDKFSWNNKKCPKLLLELGLTNNIVCVYAGKFGGLYLEDEIFSFFKTAFDEIGYKFRVLLLTSESDEKINKWSFEAGLPDNIIIKRFVPHNLVPDFIGLGDFAIAPYRPVPSRNYGAPIKISEYWALGLPVVITSNIANDSCIIEDNQLGSVINSLEIDSYRESVKKIITILQNHSSLELYDRIRPFAEKFRNFQLAKSVYQKVYLSK